MTLWPSRQLPQEKTKCYLKGTSAWWEPIFLFCIKKGKKNNLECNVKLFLTHPVGDSKGTLQVPDYRPGAPRRGTGDKSTQL